MNAYLLSAIQSAAYGSQFECSARDADSDEIIFSSMRHRNEVDAGLISFDTNGR